MWGRLHIKTTQILPFFCCIPLFQSFLSLYIPLSFANFSHSTKKICRSADHRCIFICIYFSWIFVCIKGHPSSDSGPSEENFIYPTILCKLFTLNEKNLQECGSSLYFYLYLFFLNFRVYQRSSIFWFWPLWRKFYEKSPNSRRWRSERKRAQKQKTVWASCVRVVFVSRIFIHTVRKGNFATQDWTEVGATKWRAFF